jgi:molybdopterin-guanine dinucleotide biosynthesis protein B
LKKIIIAVVGCKKSGKTTVVESLTRELAKREHKVAVVKHISEQNFTIDTKGKDTWRFAESGARTIISVSSGEVATIEKSDKRISLRAILQRCKGNDIVFLEGFRELVGKNKAVLKIVVVNSPQEASEAIKNFEPILAFTGRYSPKKSCLPYIDALRNPEKMADMIEKVTAES